MVTVPWPHGHRMSQGGAVEEVKDTGEILRSPSVPELFEGHCHNGSDH